MYEIPGTDTRKVIIDGDFVMGKASPVILRNTDEDFTDFDSDLELTDIEIRKTNTNVTKKQPEITSLQKLRPVGSGNEKLFWWKVHDLGSVVYYFNILRWNFQISH